MSNTTHSQSKRSCGVWLFLAGQPLVLALFAYAAVSGSREFHRVWHVPPLNEKPLSIRPLNDCPDVVSDEQLRRVLLRLRPRSGRAKDAAGRRGPCPAVLGPGRQI